MLAVIISLAVVALVLFASETLWRNKKMRGEEISRKLVHIIVGCFIASWGFYLTSTQIQFMSVLMLIGVLLSQKFHILHGIHAVKRRTLGEPLFAVAIFFCASLSTQPWIYFASILSLSVSDGLAAVLGTSFGRKNSYNVFGFRKSVVGTTVFFISSLIIMIAFYQLSNLAVDSQLCLLVTALIATGIENFSNFGTDNLTVPLFVMFSLESIVI